MGLSQRSALESVDLRQPREPRVSAVAGGQELPAGRLGEDGDLRVGKTFKFGPQVSTTIFWEMFNTFNWQNYYAQDNLLESPTFGVPTAARDLRRQQLGVRLDF